MCRQCAWEKIKLKCKICGEIIANGYPRLLAHITAHYATSELLHNEEAEENIILSKVYVFVVNCIITCNWQEISGLLQV